MTALKSVIITLPKGLKKDSSGLVSTGTKLNFTTSILTDKLKIDNHRKQVKHMDDTMMDTTILKQEPINIRGKKRRLDHLTWEEKLQRKKLKNRVAAQTSRDRKKAKLDELEETVRLLTERNDLLVQECTILRSENESLLNESERLKLDSESKKNDRLCSMCQGRVDFTVPSSGSAESRVNPLPQGGSVQSAGPLTLTPSAIVLLKILTLSLLSRNCSANSRETITSTDSRSWPRAFCEKLPQKWKHILLDQMSRYQSRRKPPENLHWWIKHQESWKAEQIQEA